MHRFMVDPGKIRDGVISIEGSDLKHLSQVLRLERAIQSRLSTEAARNIPHG